MLKPRFLFSASAIFGALAAGAFADTFTLKNGEKLEGRVLRESDTEVVVEVQLSSSIKDERTIKKTELASIEKVKPDEEAWKQLETLTLGNESLEPEDYTKAVTRLRTFATEFPKSPKAADANTRATAFEEEKKRTEAGELKLDGKWLTKDEVSREKVQIDGRLLFRRMQRQAGAGQLSEAMNTFDELQKRAAGSATYPDAVALARQTLLKLQPMLDRQRALLKARVEENKRRLSNVSGIEKTQLEALLAREAMQTEAAVTAYERSGRKWLPLHPSTERSLSSMASKISSETNSLNRLNLEKMKESLAHVEKTKAALASDDFVEAEAAHKLANSSWPQNEWVRRLQPQIAEARIKKMEADKIAAAEAKNVPTELPMPKPKAAVAPESAPEPVAAAAEEEVVKDEPSVLSKPTFWIILFVVLGAAFGAMKFFKRVKLLADTRLDQ